MVGRNTERLSSLVSLGAEPFVADISNKEAAYQDKVSEAIASALEKGMSEYVVALSSFGADKADKTGPIAGYFMENTLAQAGVVQQMGATAGPLDPGLEVPMIATRDIGTFAADELLGLKFRGHQTQELLGQRDVSMTEVTAAIGRASCRPGLQYRQISYDQFRGFLKQMGVSQRTAKMVVEMAEAQNSGYVRALEERSQRNTTPTSYEDFVAEDFVAEDFTAAYHASSAGVTSAKA